METTASGIDVRVDSNASQAQVRIYGSGQSDGKLYVGQSLSHGGGILYNGDDSPAQISTGDRTVLYRTITTDSVTTDHEVASWGINSSDVRFNGNLLVGYDTTSTDIHGGRIQLYRAPAQTTNYVNATYMDAFEDKNNDHGHGANAWLWRVWDVDNVGRTSAPTQSVGQVMTYSSSDGKLKTQTMQALTFDSTTTASGTAPFTVASDVLVTNLNSDRLDNQHGSYYRNAGNLNAGTISDDRLPGTISSDITGNAATTTVNGNTTSVDYSVTFHSGSTHYSNSHLTTNPSKKELKCSGDVIAFASDERLKENISPITNAIDKVKQITGYTYNFNEKGSEITGQSRDKSQLGVMAQEVQKVLPEVIAPAPGDNDYMTVKYDKMVPLLIESIKEQQSQIEQLKQEIKQLKGE